MSFLRKGPSHCIQLEHTSAKRARCLAVSQFQFHSSKRGEQGLRMRVPHFHFQAKDKEGLAKDNSTTVMLVTTDYVKGHTESSKLENVTSSKCSNISDNDSYDPDSIGWTFLAKELGKS